MKLLDKRWLDFLGYGLAVWGVWLSLLKLNEFQASSDLYKFYISGVRMAAGVSPYWHFERCVDLAVVDALSKGLCIHPSLNNPILSYFFHLFSSVGWFWFSAFITLISAAALWLVARALFGCGGISGLMFFYWPVSLSFELGQLGVLVAALVMILWLCLSQAWEQGFGVALAILVLVKPNWILLVVPLFFSMRLSLLYAGGVLMLLLGGGFALLGVRLWFEWVNALKGADWYCSSWNSSLLDFARCNFLDGEGWWLLIFLCLALAAVFGFVNRRDSLACLAFGVVFVFVVSPFGWVYYQLALVVVWGVVWRADSHRFVRAGCAAAFLMTAIPSGLNESVETAVAAPMLAVAMTLFIVLWWTWRRRRARCGARSIASSGGGGGVPR